MLPCWNGGHPLSKNFVNIEILTDDPNTPLRVVSVCCECADELAREQNEYEAYCDGWEKGSDDARR